MFVENLLENTSVSCKYVKCKYWDLFIVGCSDLVFFFSFFFFLFAVVCVVSKTCDSTTCSWDWYLEELWCVIRRDVTLCGWQNVRRIRDVARLVERRTGTLPTQVRLSGAARDFSPRVNFQCRLSYDVRTPLCAVACIYICAHVKDPVVHVRVRWMKETLKTPSMHRRLGSATLSQLAFPGKATRISHGRNTSGTTNNNNNNMKYLLSANL